MKVALKELRETLIWLKIIERKPLCDPTKMQDIMMECNELIAIKEIMYFNTKTNAYLNIAQKNSVNGNENEILNRIQADLKFKYVDVNFRDFKAAQPTQGWFGRKVIALPAAIWSGFVKTIYHLSKGILVGFLVHLGDKKYLKAHLFYGLRDLQESFGWLATLLNDKYGQYHIQESEFQKSCYNCFLTKKNTQKANSEQEKRDFSTNESLNEAVLKPNSNSSPAKDLFEEHPIISPMAEKHPIIPPTVSQKETSEKCFSEKETSSTVSKNPKNEEDNISERELQQGISISEDTISKIQTCMKNLLQRKEEGGIKLYNSQTNHRVFALETAPGLIFKMKANKNCRTLGEDDSMKARYQKIIKAQTVLRTHQLGLLVIPNAKLFTVNAEGEDYEIIAEKKVDINPYESAQEQYFQEYAESLNETIRQLAIFICKTGYSDVEWRNNPILNNSLDEKGNRRLALIDIEEMGSSETGLFGNAKRRGLVRCVNEEQAKIVEGVAKQNGIQTDLFAKAHVMRKQEIEEEQKLRECYREKNIIIGNEPIQIDEKSIDFSEYPRKVEKLRKVTKDLVQEINDKILNTSSEESIKGRRYIHISTNRKPFQYLDIKIIDNKVFSYDERLNPEEFYNTTYMGYILKKLIESRHIHKVNRNGHEYFLQA